MALAPEMIAAYASAGAVLVSAISTIFSIRNGKKINNVEIKLDGRLEELLKLTARSERAIGLKEGQDEIRPGERGYPGFG